MSPKLRIVFIIPIIIFTGIIDASAQSPKFADFRSVVESRITGKIEAEKEKGEGVGRKLSDICPIDTDILARRVFKDYGAMFIADPSVHFPDKCVFANEEEVLNFQNLVKIKKLVVGGVSIELQDAAMNALIAARDAAAKKGLDITPRGSSASRRSYADTLRIWSSRFEPALRHWTALKNISADDAARVSKLSPSEQPAEVIKWEKNGLWFSTNFDRSIFSSVAAPGTSQHLSMIALDVAEFGNKAVQQILNSHGWFQTIIDDTPHFTYLGLMESELPERGLRPVFRQGFTFWVPNFE